MLDSARRRQAARSMRAELAHGLAAFLDRFDQEAVDARPHDLGQRAASDRRSPACRRPATRRRRCRTARSTGSARPSPWRLPSSLSFCTSSTGPTYSMPSRPISGAIFSRQYSPSGPVSAWLPAMTRRWPVRRAISIAQCAPLMLSTRLRNTSGASAGTAGLKCSCSVSAKLGMPSHSPPLGRPHARDVFAAAGEGQHARRRELRTRGRRCAASDRAGTTSRAAPVRADAAADRRCARSCAPGRAGNRACACQQRPGCSTACRPSTANAAPGQG